ncbi:uncharacterized protein LOC113312159 [Papaver somniferum]|uniref:uncharacterized protein LOC113312159 n=1 Tax=Papaver somniferum TaxID=3469 RepID=UPI000E6FFEE1|nr:uncharacterized protein LOC113312159 [Papaver somniferum]
MGIFKIPDATIKELDSIQRNFWWGKEKSGGLFLTGWPAINKHKLNGGMGFRDLKCFNRALLEKAAWRLLNSEDKLCAQALKGRYFPTTSGLHAKKKKNSTWAWQSIQGSMQFIFKCSLLLVGNGQKISIWTDNWIQGEQEPHTPAVELEIANTYNKVSDLIDQDTKSWNVTVVQHLFNQQDA